MKVLLITIAIGDKYVSEYTKLFYPSQKRYADKHGYDFKVITNFFDYSHRRPSNISFNKILVCDQHWSKTYDYIIFIDADILININAPPIHNFHDFGNKIGIINEYSQPTYQKRLEIQKKMGWEETASEYYKLAGFNIPTTKVLNTGVLVFQPKIHNKFLKSIYNRYISASTTHPRGYHFEQSCIGYELQINNLYKETDNRFNAIWSLEKASDSNLTLQDFFDSNFFIHFAGRCDFDKIIQLKI